MDELDVRQKFLNMKCYLISYDLAEGGDYQALHQAIKSHKPWAHITESLWAIMTPLSATEVRDSLTPLLPRGSRIIVIKSGVEAAWRNVICTSEWLKKNL